MDKIIAKRNYMRNLREKVRHWGAKELCSSFGINYDTKKENARLAALIFQAVSEDYQVPRSYAPIASRAFLLKGVGEGILEDSFLALEGDIVLTHPLKSLSDKENILLAAVLTGMRADAVGGAGIKEYLKKMQVSKKYVPVVEAAIESVQLAEKQAIHSERECSGGQNGESLSFSVQLELYVSKQLDIIRRLTEKTSDYGDPEVIHDIRVAFRKLYSVTGVFSRYLKPQWSSCYQPELNRNLKQLGALRDLDILNQKQIYFLEKKGIGPEVFPVWNKIIGERREGCLRAIEQHFSSDEFPKLAAAMEEEIKQGICTPVLCRGKEACLFFPEEVKEECVRRAVMKIKAQKNWMEGLLVPEPVLHKLRLSFKELRYVLDFFRQILDKEEAEMLEAATLFQEVLGDLHDESVLLQEIRKLCKKSERYQLDPEERTYLKKFEHFSEKERNRHFALFEKHWEAYGKKTYS